MVTADEVRRLFIDSLVEATADLRSRVRVVLTLRADFYDHPLGDELFGPHRRETSLALAVPAPPQLREAIERPAASAGVVFEEGLTDQLLGDVAGQPGSLPLLQFALERVVAGSVDGGVTGADYQRLGGVQRSVDPACRGRVPLSSAPSSSRSPRRSSCGWSPSPRTPTTSRRWVRQSELESLGLDPGDVDRGAHPLRGRPVAHLRPSTRSPGTHRRVAHEALLRHWERLRHWLDNRREALLLHRRFPRHPHRMGPLLQEDDNYLLTGGTAHPVRDLGLPPRGHPHPRGGPLPRAQRHHPQPSRNPPPPSPPRHPRRLRRRRPHRPNPRHHRPHPTPTSHRIGPTGHTIGRRSGGGRRQAEQAATQAGAIGRSGPCPTTGQRGRGRRALRPRTSHPPRPRRPRTAAGGR